MHWPTIYILYSLKSREKLMIHKALQFLRLEDLSLAYHDENTAVSLFTVALEGFTSMDVHWRRAEYMLHLGDIHKGHDDVLKAVELWKTARPLFEQSSQSKQVRNIDERLACVGEDVREQHRVNLMLLTELNAPSGSMEKTDNDILRVSIWLTNILSTLLSLLAFTSIPVIFSMEKCVSSICISVVHCVCR
jgi:hypothetical protein